MTAPGASVTALTPAIAMGAPDVVQLPASVTEPACKLMPEAAILLAAVSASAPAAIKINRPFGALTLPAMVMVVVDCSVSVLADSQVSTVPGASLMLPASSVTLPAASMASSAVILMTEMSRERWVGAVSLMMMARGSSAVMFAGFWFDRAAVRS